MNELKLQTKAFLSMLVAVATISITVKITGGDVDSIKGALLLIILWKVNYNSLKQND